MEYSTRFPGVLAGWLACAALVLVAPLAAQDYRLSDPPKPGSTIRDFRVTPEGKQVVYLARVGSSPNMHAYLVDVLQPRDRRLLDPRSMSEIELAGRRLVFAWSDGATARVGSLALDGNEPPVDLGIGQRPKATPDGKTLVLQRSDGLYCMPVDGSAPARRIHSVTTSSIHHQWKLSPDSRRVLYVTEGSIGFSAGIGHLYSAALDGSSAPVALNTSAVPASVGNFLFSPDSRWVVFRRVDIQRGVALYSVPIDGSAPAARLHDPLPFAADVGGFHAFSTPLFTPDGSRVVYQLEQEAAGLQELYSARLDGSSPPVKLSDGTHRYVILHRLSPDGTRVVFTASPATVDDPFELFWVPTGGGVHPQRLSDPLPADGLAFLFAVAPDNEHVVYLLQHGQPRRNELLSVSMSGVPAPLTLSLPHQSCFAWDSEALQFAEHGNSVVFGAVDTSLPQPPLELFAVPLAGTAPPRRLSGPMTPGGGLINLNPFTFSPVGGPFARFAANETVALFRADQEIDQTFELWAAPIRSGHRRR